jgi:hypothetical protein
MKLRFMLALLRGRDRGGDVFPSRRAMRTAAARWMLVAAGVAAGGCGPARTDPETPADQTVGGVTGSPAPAEDAAQGEWLDAALAEAARPAFCPRTFEGSEDDWELWLEAEDRLRVHYGVDEETRVLYDGGAIRAVELADGGLLVAVAFGTYRFGLWRRQMERSGEWEAVHARAMEALERCLRTNYERCIADIPEEDWEEYCGDILLADEDRLEEVGCDDIWDGIGPERGPDCCICDTLVAATFSVRRGADGRVDAGSLRLLGEGTVLDRRCNPGLSIGTFEIADLDEDGRYELFFQQGKDEHDSDEYEVEPYTVVVLRDDGTVQHRLDYGGITIYPRPPEPMAGTWYRFEDRSGDGRPDLVLETFELDREGCSERRHWFPTIVDPDGAHRDNPSYEPVYDEYDECNYDYTEECAAAAAALEAPTDCLGGTARFQGWHGAPIAAPPTVWDEVPGCERRNVETRVFAYDPDRDAWFAGDAD